MMRGRLSRFKERTQSGFGAQQPREWDGGVNTVSSTANWADSELKLSLFRVSPKLTEGMQFSCVAELGRGFPRFVLIQQPLGLRAGRARSCTLLI